jgi:hypothetical protein
MTMQSAAPGTADATVTVSDLVATLLAVVREAQPSGSFAVSSLSLLARGKYGDIYMYKGFPASPVLGWLRGSKHAKGLVIAEGCLEGFQDVVVKLQALPNEQWDRDAMGEDHCHRLAHLRLGAKRVVPAFGFGATVRMTSAWSPKAAAGVRMTVMEHLAGAATLGSLDKQGAQRLDRGVYRRVEDAACALWRCGVAHCDMHPGNIVLMPDGSVRLLDFGMATIMPRRTAAAMRRRLRVVGTDKDAAFDEVYIQRAAAVMRRRGIYDDAVINYDGLALRWMRAQWWVLH